MNNDFEDKPILKIRNISTMLEDLGNHAVVLTNEGHEQKIVPVSCLNEYDYVKTYIYRLKADNKGLNLIVDNLIAKEEKQEDKDNKWISFKYGKNNEYIGLTKVSNIDWFEYTNEHIVMYLKNHDESGFFLSKESYEELTKLLVGKENE